MLTFLYSVNVFLDDSSVDVFIYYILNLLYNLADFLDINFRLLSISFFYGAKYISKNS